MTRTKKIITKAAHTKIGSSVPLSRGLITSAPISTLQIKPTAPITTFEGNSALHPPNRTLMLAFFLMHLPVAMQRQPVSRMCRKDGKLMTAEIMMRGKSTEINLRRILNRLRQTRQRNYLF